MVPLYSRGAPILSVNGISMTFKGTNGALDVPVLDNITEQIVDLVRPGVTTGQVVGFLGPSGGGKTTLFRIIAGLLQPTSGTVGLGVEQRPVVLGEIGVVQQHYPLFKNRRVLGNLLVAGEAAGLSPTQAKERAQQLLERFGLADKALSYPSQLSGGQRQRVAISQQLMRNAPILLMDEPFSGLDPNAKDEVCALINEVANLDEMNTIVVVSHDINSEVQIADTLWIMGRPHEVGVKPTGASRIVKTYNLIDRGLAWQPNVTMQPAFDQTVREIRQLFKTI